MGGSEGGKEEELGGGDLGRSYAVRIQTQFLLLTCRFLQVRESRRRCMMHT